MEQQRQKKMKNTGNVHLFYQNNAKYYLQVKRFIDTFGKQNVHIIIFDDFKSNPSQEYLKTLEFLGVDTKFKIDFKKINSDQIKNSSKTPRNMMIHKILHFFSYQPKSLNKIGKLIPIKNKSILYKFLRDINTKYQPRKPLDPTLRKTLIINFTPEIKELEKLIDKDLSHWYKDIPQEK